MPNHRRKTPRNTPRRYSRKTRKSSHHRRKRGGNGSRSKSTIKRVMSRFSSKRKSAARVPTVAMARDSEISPSFCQNFHGVFPFDTVPKGKTPIPWNRENLATCKKFKDALIR